MKSLQQTLAALQPADRTVYRQAEEAWGRVAKPLGSLGLFEGMICRLAAAQRRVPPSLDRCDLVVFCSDNGVVAEGVTQTDARVTNVVAKGLCSGEASVSKMAEVAGVRVHPVDIGMRDDLPELPLIHRKIAHGTRNLAEEPAMSREEAVRAIEVGIELAETLAAEGSDLLLTGEMGIGNTTTSSAMASVLLAVPPAEMTGRGAGLSSEGLSRKVEVIERAIERMRPDREDPLGVLAMLGGFDLAGLCGLMLGAAAAHRPVLLDGFIACTAALCAVRMAPAVGSYLLASHLSDEPATARVLDALELRPPIRAGLRLGEGTGAVMAVPPLRMALAVYRGTYTFERAGMDPYRPLD